MEKFRYTTSIPSTMGLVNSILTYGKINGKCNWIPPNYQLCIVKVYDTKIFIIFPNPKGKDDCITIATNERGRELINKLRKGKK